MRKYLIFLFVFLILFCSKKNPVEDISDSINYPISFVITSVEVNPNQFQIKFTKLIDSGGSGNIFLFKEKIEIVCSYYYIIVSRNSEYDNWGEPYKGEENFVKSEHIPNDNTVLGDAYIIYENNKLKITSTRIV